METVQKTLKGLCNKINDRENRAPVTFDQFLEFMRDRPERVIRNIFQMMHDMIDRYVGGGVEEYPDDPESINYVNYDCSKLFEDKSENPFFADRLFANRLINHVASFRRGIQQNRIYIFEGPHGCGKSTFLNNLLMKFEQYANTPEGLCYEILWRLDKEALGVLQEAQTILMQLKQLANGSSNGVPGGQREPLFSLGKKTYLDVPCPSHDHPLLLIPKAYRREVLEDLIEDREFKEKLFSEKQYEWVFRANPCTVCQSLYQVLLEMLGSPAKVFEMVHARRYQFNRRLGEGISVFNPGDRVIKNNVMTNDLLQNQLNLLFKDSNRVQYTFSRYAKTNNGIYAIMDVKDHNKERFANLHGIISEGVHKVEDIEENVNSLFLALMNPEDRGNIPDTHVQSFSDRITYIKIPYVLDYNTEVKIYKNVFGDQIEKSFLPKVLQNLAKVIISSRLNGLSGAMSDWISESEKYGKYCDRDLLLLKMDIYGGHIPDWLTEEDRKRFTAKRRTRIVAESELEGNEGFSGRDSIKIFSEFYSSYAKRDKLITMAMVCHFFCRMRKDLADSIPKGFLDSLVRSYNYSVLQCVKESLYSYNEEQIARDIMNYLFAVNFEAGTLARSVYTGEDLEITEEFFQGIEGRLLGANGEVSKRKDFRKDVQKQYTSKTLSQDMMLQGRSLKETDVYKTLHERYVYNLKSKVLDPFLRNENFRSAIKDYDTESFKTYDRRIREEVTFLMKNLKKKYGYAEQGAKEVCIYVIDNKLAETFE